MAAPAAKMPPIWTTGSTEELNTGTWRNDIAVHQKRPAPCHNACPVDGAIPEWIRQLRNEDIHGAWLTLMEHNPIPASIGRVCHRPCESVCNRQQYDGAVAINALEQYVGDFAIRKSWAFPSPTAEKEQKVAIVGGGPAGLSCAFQLRRMGYGVTLFDANPELGGVLRYGVPDFRLPRGVVAAEAARVVAMGVQVVSGRRMCAADLDDLQKDYAAVFIAFGAHNSKHLPQFPKSDPNVVDAIAFLRSVKLGAPMSIGTKVAVIGGGSVAMDCAASAIRLGSSATVVAIEKRGAMPAEEGEIADVLDEGGALIDGAMVKKVQVGSGVFRLGCVKAELDPNAPAGVIVPVEVKGTDFELEADTVILAVGQDPEIDDWQASLRTSRNMVTIDDRYMTSRDGVFAAGDAASAVRFVSTAVGDGKRAAQSIARYLGASQAAGEQASAATVGFADINTFYFPPAEQRERNKLDAAERNSGFNEIRLGYSVEEALAQSDRCFSCGDCTECDNCFYYCPDMAIVKDPASPLHYRVLEQYCKGCGACVTECPRGAMILQEEMK
ncbi:MAG: FAD-dependent oxidoreductase [Betaproteobacteria bacterium]|nr:FAD-dependent oxidoreductase [Betaproteobacteria bacterium]